MKDSQDRPDPSELLEAFIASGKGEREFAKLVNSLSGLVYSSAFRRTRDSGLAEEIAQNVFAVLARKAESLRRHPCLTAWVLETTRLQSASAMRSERRRQRKIAALADESQTRQPRSPDAMDQQATWKDAVPHLDDALGRLPMKDRKVILERFFEEKKFKEIAGESGQSEAAIKMRVKRALGKLSTLLSARGVSLSGTAVASLLGTELARSAPAQMTAAMAPKALAASSSISGLALFANTLQTMSTAKTATATAAAVLALAAVPIASQHAEGARLRAELRGGAGQETSSEVEPGGVITALGKGGAGGQAGFTEPRTASRLLADLERPMAPRLLLKSLFDAFGSPDSLGDRVAFMRLASLSREDYDELLKALPEFPSDNATKGMLRRMITSYAPEMSPREQLDRLLASGVKEIVSDNYMHEWASSEPEAALAWYREKQASGELYGEGLDSSVQKHLFEMLLLGLAGSRPEQALNLYLSAPETELGSNARYHLTGGLTGAMMRTGDDAPLVKLMDSTPAGKRKEILRKVFSTHAGAGRFDEGMAFIDRHDPALERRNGHIQQMILDLTLDGVANGFDWVAKTTPESEAPAFVRQLVAARPYGCREWIESQPPGELRDHGYAGIVDRLLKFDKYAEAKAEAANIGEPAFRAATIEKIDGAVTE